MEGGTETGRQIKNRNVGIKGGKERGREAERENINMNLINKCWFLKCRGQPSPGHPSS